MDFKEFKQKTKDMLDVLADEYVSEKRISICESCPHFIKKFSQCDKCKCFMRIKSKVKSAKCPIGKW